MWLKNEYDDRIDIQPAGEQDRHIPELVCECGPRPSQSDDRRLMIIHRSFDGTAGFESVAVAERRAA